MPEELGAIGNQRLAASWIPLMLDDRLKPRCLRSHVHSPDAGKKANDWRALEAGRLGTIGTDEAGIPASHEDDRLARFFRRLPDDLSLSPYLGVPACDAVPFHGLLCKPLSV